MKSSIQDLPKSLNTGHISDVFLMDCMIGMAGFPDKYFDLAVVDVNYGIKQDGRNNHTRGGKTKFGGKFAIGGSRVPPKDYRKNSRYDDTCPPQLYFNELLRLSKNQIIFGANHFISKIPYDASCWIVWDKKNDTTDFADCELAWTSFDTAVRMFRYKWNGMLQENMQDKEERIHPNHKPTALYDWIYKNYLPQGGKVIDTHLGSGSNRIAAHKAGNIDFTGYEIDKDYYEAQEKRWKGYISQTKLF